MSADPLDSGMPLSHPVLPSYDDLKALARNLKRPVGTLLALDGTRDPWSVEQPRRLEMAHWYADLASRHGLPGEDHLRRLHYRVLSLVPAPLLPDGNPYENTDLHWQKLLNASLDARHLGLIGRADLRDQRSPQMLHGVDFRPSPQPDAGFGFADGAAWLDLPSIGAQFRDESATLVASAPQVTGYDYSLSDQPYYLVVVIEKQTMEDVLVPICRQFGADYSPGQGFSSQIRAREILDRAMQRGKPARIFSISDFDPAGDSMPISTARQVEHLLASDPNAYPEVKLTHLALTSEQVVRFTLPRKPIKEKDTRREAFEDRRGEGAVELDALEALQPGALAAMLREAMQPYFDTRLAARLTIAHLEADRAVRDQWQRHAAAEIERLKVLQQRVAEINNPFRVQLQALSERHEAALAEERAELASIQADIEARERDFDPTLPERPVGEAESVGEDDWLFDSSREYFDQNDHYQAHKGGLESMERRRLKNAASARERARRQKNGAP